jgi:hypothetical protein
MAWIESHQELRQHPKTRRLARALGVSLPTAIGHLHCFWWWAMDYAQDGSLARYDAGDIADAAEYDGDPEKFAEALRSAGFIRDDVIHDWYDYAGRLIERRAANAERKRLARIGDTPTEDQDVPRPSRGQDEDGSRCPGATKPDLTVPNQTEPEQTDTEPIAADAAQPSKRITKAFREQMRQEYPDVDEAEQFDKATNHVAYRKAIDKQRYYRNWLKRADEWKRDRSPPNVFEMTLDDRKQRYRALT